LVALYPVQTRQDKLVLLCAVGAGLQTATNNSTMGTGKERVPIVFAPFSPGDSFRIYRLQRKGVVLDLQRALTQPHTPLWEAYLAFLTQQAMGQPTYVLYDPHDGEAFIQMRYRPHQAAADVTYLSPSLSENRNAAKAWSRLLDGACIEAASRGIQRVFANLTESSPEVDTFHQAGFMLYAGEDIYRSAHVEADRRHSDVPGLRPQHPEDWPAIQKLCVAITPQRVRQAEGGIAVATGWEKNCQRYVLPSKENEDLAAVLSLCMGGLAHWLRVLVHPDAQQGIETASGSNAAEDLIRWGLARLNGYSPRPVYCNVRQYESGVHAGLLVAGFEPLTTRVLMVKHTVAWVKTPSSELVPALKGSAEPVPPALRINGEPEFQTSKAGLAAKHDA
jgi:hypothetical protein